MGEVCHVTGRECDILTAMKEAHASKKLATELGSRARSFESHYGSVVSKIQEEYCIDEELCGILGFTEMTLVEDAIEKIEKELRQTRRDG